MVIAYIDSKLGAGEAHYSYALQLRPDVDEGSGRLTCTGG